MSEKPTTEPLRFDKPFTQQEPIPDAAIARVVDVLQSGRLHRYNTLPGEPSEAAELEREYAAWQGAKYALACASGGYALQVALRASGLRPGEPVLANAWTLAPVPGAIHNAGGVPVFVEIDENWHINIDDLAAKARDSGARMLMLSHMRGHVADMDRIVDVCDTHGITVVEDCAHTMGASWRGKRSGNFGRVACFSTQTYKHLNSGEGGLLTTDDPDIAARAIVHSGSYMLYESHGARPDTDAFDAIKLQTPNYSGRMDNMRAAMLRAQLQGLDLNIARWNERYSTLSAGLAQSHALHLPARRTEESYVGSSIQFHASSVPVDRIPAFLAACLARGVEIKWFGAADPAGFTSRYDSWRYLGALPKLERTLKILSTTCDIRVPLTFTPEDCTLVARIVAEEADLAAV